MFITYPLLLLIKYSLMLSISFILLLSFFGVQRGGFPFLFAELE